MTFNLLLETLRMNYITFNPLNLNPNKEQYNFLSSLFGEADDKESYLFLKGVDYPYHDNKDQFIVRFTHTLLRIHNEDHPYQYHILANEALGSGGHGTVYPILKSMALTDDETCVYNEPVTPLIAKMQSIKGSKAEVERFAKKMLNEFEHSKDGHLNAQEPMFIRKARSQNVNKPELYDVVGAMVMNRMMGIEFFDLLVIFMEMSDIACSLRFLLTFELINAFNEQVFKENKVHGDLKPENIIIIGGDGLTLNNFVQRNDLKNKNYVPAWKMKTIDFEGAHFLGKKRDFSLLTGTPCYMASEAHTAEVVDDEKLDLNSLATIMALLWGAEMDNKTNCIYFPDKQKALFDAEPVLLKESLVPAIYAAIGCMRHKDPNLRWGLKQSLAFFENIAEAYHHLMFIGTLPDIAELNLIKRSDSVMDELTHEFNPLGVNPNQSDPITISPTAVNEIEDNDLIRVRKSPVPTKFYNLPVTPSPVFFAAPNPELEDVPMCECRMM